MTPELLFSRLRDELANGPVDIASFVAGFFPHDIEAGQLLTWAFDAKLLRGRLRTNLIEFDGRIIGACR